MKPGAAFDVREVLIEAVYDAVLDHARFEEVLGLVLALVEAAVEEQGGLDDTLVTHFERAEFILGRIARPEPSRSSDDSAPGTPSHPMIIASRDGRILSTTPVAEQALGLRPGSMLSDLVMHADSTSRLEALQKHGDDQERLVLRATRIDDTRPMTFSARLVPLEDRSQRGVALQELSMRFSPSTVDLVMRSFGLTRAETEVLSHLAEGMTPAEIADTRARSIKTIRTQIRSLVAKTDASHVTDLVGLALGAAQVALSGIDTPQGPDGPRRLVRLPDGRNVDLAEHGDPHGRPVLFIHGCLAGRRLPDPADAALRQHGIRLLCPARPCHGASDPLPEVSDQALAADWCALLDVLGIRECPAVAYDIGVGITWRAALHMQGRLSSLTGLATLPPLTDWAALTGMPMQQRIFPTLARLSPALVGYLARVGDRRLREAGREGFAEIVFKDAPKDIEMCCDPDLLRLFWEGHLFHVENGSESFIGDVFQSVLPVPDLGLSVHLIHGRNDTTIAPRTIQRFAHQKGLFIEWIEGAGHTLPFSHWKEWLRRC
ncbi:MAG: alpha/beta fold hydrolase [Pseudomonadota bacterium]